MQIVGGGGRRIRQDQSNDTAHFEDLFEQREMPLFLELHDRLVTGKSLLVPTRLEKKIL